jgi:prepilin-type N-terminal cleavage/methylation domain-containing protein
MMGRGSRKPTPHRLAHARAGFTLVELLVVVAISLILFGLISINLGQSQTSISLSSVANTLLSDIKNQQLQAMTGGIGSTSAQQPHGLYMQAGSYTLFAGSSYSAGDSNNFVVTAPSTVSISTSFSGSTLLFTKGAGEVQSFINGSNTITLTGIGGSKTVTVGRFGALSVN